jgi:hypothetical protein
MLMSGRWAVYLCAVGVEGGLCVVCLYGLGVEVEGLVPFLVPEGIVALVLELGGFVGWGAHDVSTQCGTGLGRCEARGCSCRRRDGLVHLLIDRRGWLRPCAVSDS